MLWKRYFDAILELLKWQIIGRAVHYLDILIISIDLSKFNNFNIDNQYKCTSYTSGWFLRLMFISFS
jgi:hypothetical protein